MSQKPHHSRSKPIEKCRTISLLIFAALCTSAYVTPKTVIISLDAATPRIEQTLAEQSPDERKKKQTETMLEAHETLCEAAPENVLRFKGVLDFLGQELHYDAPSK
jgi:hypothetical protein